MFPELGPDAQKLAQQTEFLFQIEVNKPKIKVSHRFKPIYEKF